MPPYLALLSIEGIIRMKLSPFKAIRFDSNYWKNNDFSLLDNCDTKNKIDKTKVIMDFLKQKINSGIAKIDQEPALYILKVDTAEKSVTSIIGEINYNDRDVFLPNEEIHKDKLDFYKNVFDEYKMQINPVLTFYRGNDSVISITKFITEKQPEVSAFIQGMSYKLWKVSNPENLNRITNTIAKIDKLYIADGHHRFAMFHARENLLNAKIMVSITDSDSILLKSCHRVITKNITPLWRKKLEEYCDLNQINPKNTPRNDKILIKFRNGALFEINFKYDKFHDTAIHRIIKNTIIRYSFEIEDYNNQVFPVGGNMSPEKSDQIFKNYQNGSAIIFVPNIQMSEFLKILDSGSKLPPTTTWFEPKIIDGFLISKYY